MYSTNHLLLLITRPETSSQDFSSSLLVTHTSPYLLRSETNPYNHINSFKERVSLSPPKSLILSHPQKCLSSHELRQSSDRLLSGRRLDSSLPLSSARKAQLSKRKMGSKRLTEQYQTLSSQASTKAVSDTNYLIFMIKLTSS